MGIKNWFLLGIYKKSIYIISLFANHSRIDYSHHPGATGLYVDSSAPASLA